MDMERLPLLVACSVALAVLGFGGLIYGYFLRAQQKILRQRRFERLEQKATEAPGQGFELLRDVAELTTAEKIVLFFSGHLPMQPAGGNDSEDRRLLIQAGYRSLNSLILFHALRWLFLSAILVSFAAYALFSHRVEDILRGIALIIVVILAPRYLLRYLASRRLQRLEEELPLFIDYLRMMHSVGISFEQAIILFAQEQRLGLPVLSSELAMVGIAIRSGRSRSEALQLMASQLEVEDLSELVGLICHTDYYGAAVLEPLRQFSQRLTERKRFQMQEYVGKLATRMVIVMVVFLLPALIIVTAGPGFISVFKALGKMA